jgi:hypothetical protein
LRTCFYKDSKCWKIFSSNGDLIFSITKEETPLDLRKNFEKKEFGNFLLNNWYKIEKKEKIACRDKNLEELEKKIEEKFSGSDVDFIFSKFQDPDSKIWEELKDYGKENVLKLAKKIYFKKKTQKYTPIKEPTLKLLDCIKIVLSEIQKEKRLESFLEDLTYKKEAFRELVKRLIEKGASEVEVLSYSPRDYLSLLIPEVLEKESSSGTYLSQAPEEANIKLVDQRPAYEYSLGREPGQIIERPEQLVFTEKKLRIGDKVRLVRPIKVKSYLDRSKYILVPRGTKGVVQGVVEDEGTVKCFRIWFDSSEIMKEIGIVPTIPGDALTFDETEEVVGGF